MKTVYFVRHAKSNWSDPSLSDHDRPLHKRGLRDAPKMAARLAGLGVRPDGILTSSAQRTRQTAAYFADALNVSRDDRLTDQALYHARPDGIERRVRQLPDGWGTVLLFGHNPGYTDLANQLAHDHFIDNVPTCGIVVAKAAVDDWADFRLAGARRTAFMYPKEI